MKIDIMVYGQSAAVSIYTTGIYYSLSVSFILLLHIGFSTMLMMLHPSFYKSRKNQARGV